MMVDRGYIDAASMTGSWAGAMGQTQFMPTELHELRGRLRRRRPSRHLEVECRCARLDRQLPERLRLERRRDVGPRSARAAVGARAHYGHDSQTHDGLLRHPQHDRASSAGRMARARRDSRRRQRRCRTPTSPPASSTSANASSSSIRTTTPSSATTARTTTRSPSPCSATVCARLERLGTRLGLLLEVSVSSPYESATLLIRLYELRRETTMREARTWYARSFSPDVSRRCARRRSADRTAPSSAWSPATGRWPRRSPTMAPSTRRCSTRPTANTSSSSPRFSRSSPSTARRIGSPKYLAALEKLVMTAPGLAERLPAIRDRFNIPAPTAKG